MLLYLWVSGALFPDDAGGRLSPARIAGMALTYSTTPASLLAGLLYLQRSTAASLDQLIDSGSVDRGAARACARKGAACSRAQNVAATLVGLILGSTQVSWLLLSDNVGGARMFMTISIAVGNLVTWLAVVHVFMRRGQVSMALRRLGREQTKADLLRLDALLPFGRIGTIQHARKWSLDTTALSRIAIYFIIPRLAWVGGAIVEIVPQAVIEPGSWFRTAYATLL